MPTDYAARDREARVTFYVPLWKRNGIPLESFDDYWRDIHGPVCARLRGQFQYWQWHVAHDEGGLFPEEPGVSYAADAEEQFDGIAELTFRSPEDRETWFTDSTILMADEHNLFRKAIGYITEPGNSQTLVDRIEDGAPNGSQGVVKYHMMLKMRGKADDRPAVERFRRHLAGTFAAASARSEHVAKLRLHLFEPPNVSRPPASGVAHADPPDRLCQAAIEIAFASGIERERFFASDDYRAAAEGLSEHVGQILVFPERNGYTFVYGGRMTLAGRRGSRAASLISSLGATNQLQDNIAQLLGIREPNA